MSQMVDILPTRQPLISCFRPSDSNSSSIKHAVKEGIKTPSNRSSLPSPPLSCPPSSHLVCSLFLMHNHTGKQPEAAAAPPAAASSGSVPGGLDEVVGDERK